jgi:HD-like signal output (HDOD) protein
VVVVKYWITIIREHQVTLTMEAASRLDIIRLVTNLAIKYDAIDGKQTKIVSINEEAPNTIRNIPA